MKIRRLLTLFLAVCLCFTMIAVPVFAAETSGSCGSGVNWSYDAQSGTLSITGSGAVQNYETLTSIPWKTYCPDIKTVEIGEGITRIGNYSLTWLEKVSSITLPSTLTEIGENALAWNTSLTSVALPAGLKKIDDEAFTGCYSLASIDIPASVDSLKSTAFTQCTALSAVNIAPDNATYSSFDGVVYNKTANSLVVYPPNKTGTDFTVPENIVTIEDSAFRDNPHIINVTIGNVNEIKSRAFSGCENLYNVDIKGVQTIGDFAFYGCVSMVKIIIPANTASVGSRAFRACINLQLAGFLGSSTQIGTEAFRDAKYLGIAANMGSNAQNYAAQNGINFYSIANVVYNGSPVAFDPMAFVVNDSRTMTPMRAVFEMLGAQVSWDEATNTAIATKDGVTVSIQIGSNQLFKNGEPITLDVPGQLIADRTYVPMRAVSEAFGNTVTWDEASHTATIS